MIEPPHWSRFTVSGSPTYPASCSTCLDCRTAHMWGHSPNCDSESLKPWILAPSPLMFLLPHLGLYFTLGGGGGMKSGSLQQTSRNPGHLLSSGVRAPNPFLMSISPAPSVMMVPLEH